jgi:hypothetical protein
LLAYELPSDLSRKFSQRELHGCPPAISDHVGHFPTCRRVGAHDSTKIGDDFVRRANNIPVWQRPKRRMIGQDRSESSRITGIDCREEFTPESLSRLLLVRRRALPLHWLTFAWAGSHNRAARLHSASHCCFAATETKGRSISSNRTRDAEAMPRRTPC